RTAALPAALLRAEASAPRLGARLRPLELVDHVPDLRADLRGEERARRRAGRTAGVDRRRLHLDRAVLGLARPPLRSAQAAVLGLRDGWRAELRRLALHGRPGAGRGGAAGGGLRGGIHRWRRQLALPARRPSP